MAIEIMGFFLPLPASFPPQAGPTGPRNDVVAFFLRPFRLGLTLQEGLVGLGDEVHDVIENERRAEQALDGLLLLDRRDEGGLKLRVEPDVPAHQDERIDGFVQGNPLPEEPLRVLREVGPGAGKGAFHFTYKPIREGLKSSLSEISIYDMALKTEQGEAFLKI